VSGTALAAGLSGYPEPGANVLTWQAEDAVVVADLDGTLLGHATGPESTELGAKTMHKLKGVNRKGRVVNREDSGVAGRLRVLVGAAALLLLPVHTVPCAEPPQVPVMSHVGYKWTLLMSEAPRRHPRTTASNELGEKLVAEARYYAETGWKNNDFSTSPVLLAKLTAELRQPRYLHAAERGSLQRYQALTLAGAAPLENAGADGNPPAKQPGMPNNNPQPPQSDRTDDAARQAELAKWDAANSYRSQTGPGGTSWDGQYRSFIQTDENAAAKGFPTHAEAARQIKEDAAKSPAALAKHLGMNRGGAGNKPSAVERK
jgi:hypothetical protein